MNRLKSLSLCLLISAVCAGSQAVNAPINTLADYNRAIPHWGVSWSGAYMPSFYTGFVMRSEFPERIHLRLSRGHNTRISVVLDEQTVSDYLFDLVKRYEVYKRISTNGQVQLSGRSDPQLQYFNAIIESGSYGILSTVQQAKAGGLSREQVYSKGLEVLKALNPGRIFIINIDLKREFLKWKADVASGNALATPASQIEAINTLVFGRINYTGALSADVTAKLAAAVQAAQANAPEAEFVSKAFDLFKAVTGSKYALKVVGPSGQFSDAVKCSPERCMLSYPEFTGVYPTGSAIGKTRDEHGNSINVIRTPGLWSFLSYDGTGSNREVDVIEDEPYYGWIPKMFFQSIGNAYHNPAVRTWGVSSSIKQALNVNPKHDTLWAVKRGGVSHGCARLPAASMWEMRHIFPVTNEKMKQVHYFGAKHTDFDVYDIDGNGTLEVMGVEYLISYEIKSEQGAGYREGADGTLQVGASRKRAFYDDLYGPRNVFTVGADGKYSIINPRVSMPSSLDYKKEQVAVRPQLQGNFPLYEQKYEQDKMQFYTLPGMNTRFIRLMGRIRGCAPTSDKNACGEAAFDKEMAGLVK